MKSGYLHDPYFMEGETHSEVVIISGGWPSGFLFNHSLRLSDSMTLALTSAASGFVVLCGFSFSLGLES